MQVGLLQCLRWIYTSKMNTELATERMGDGQSGLRADSISEFWAESGGEMKRMTCDA